MLQTSGESVTGNSNEPVSDAHFLFHMDYKHSNDVLKELVFQHFYYFLFNCN